MVTLDTMADLFRQRSTQSNAILYRNVALQYWEDNMIEDTTLLDIFQEIMSKKCSLTEEN